MPVDRSTLFIDGGWVAPSTSSRVTVLNAATEDVLGHGAGSGHCRRGSSGGGRVFRCRQLRVSATTPADRAAAAMNRFADELEKRSGELTRTVGG